jgi:hypothetical protein
MLRLALDEARSRVFNKMPIRIRLLVFNSDGSEIRFLDWNAIWDRVFTSMEADFNDNLGRAEFYSYLIFSFLPILTLFFRMAEICRQQLH